MRAATNVSVLNGTGSNGLAAKVQQQLVAAGYKEGLRDNAQGGATTVVYYAEGSRAAARDIAKRLQHVRREADRPGDARGRRDGEDRRHPWPGPGQLTANHTT